MGLKVDSDQQKPSLADDEKFRDRLLELDGGLGVRDPAAEHPTRPLAKAPARPEPAEAPSPSELPIASFGSLAPRRRPWRTPIAAGSLARDLVPQAPEVGERARGPSIGDAPAPSLAPSRQKRSLADASLTYDLFYGFEEQPFGPSSDLKFIYRSVSFDRATQDLMDAIDRREGVMVVTGENGTGKTTLRLSLVGQIGGATRPSLLTDPPASVRELFEAVQGSAVVVIDEAQRLSIEVLEQLYRLSEGGRGGERLQIVLAGEPELLRLLRHRGLRGLNRRVRTRCRLDALMADEVADYLAHRIAVAGPNARIAFDQGAATAMYACSRGIPRVINLVADRALAEGHQIPVGRIDKTDRK